MVQQGWQNSKETDLIPYQWHKDEPTVHDGYLIWGIKVVVPPPGRDKITRELHEGHPGITRMKALDRSFVWWSQIDNDLEELVKILDIYLLWLSYNLGNGHRGPRHEFMLITLDPS